jgi:hypothetical protein
MNYLNDPNKFSEQEFDQFLREADDWYGEAASLNVPTDFVARVVDRAQAEMASTIVTAKPEWSLQNWFYEFSLAVRLATAFALLVAAFGGVRAGLTVTELIARRNAPPVVELADPLGLAAPEQSIVQLIHNDELSSQKQTNRNSGEQR